MAVVAEKAVGRETVENYVVKKSIKIKASPTAVWRALTTPERTKKYFFNCEVFSEWQKGSDIVFKGKVFFFMDVEFQGKIVQIEPETLLKYTLKNSNSDSVSIVTDKLTYKNGYTTLTITDDVGNGDGAEKRFKRSKRAWDKVLKGLKNVVEREKRKYHSSF